MGEEEVEVEVEVEERGGVEVNVAGCIGVRSMPVPLGMLVWVVGCVAIAGCGPVAVHEDNNGRKANDHHKARKREEGGRMPLVWISLDCSFVSMCRWCVLVCVVGVVDVAVLGYCRWIFNFLR